MMYEGNLKEAVLDVLENRISSIADCILVLTDNGYIPNRNKMIILDWSSILIDAYENISIFSEEQHTKLDNLYNRVMRL